jgi:thiol-disulfide isomerase/thioredoxin
MLQHPSYFWPMVLSLGVVAALVALATGLGVAHRALTGRARHVRTEIDLPDEVELGSDATLLQFSTPLCSPCRATHTVLDGVARERGGLRHVDLDISDRRDLASRFNIMQTPTTLILDATGTVRARIGGAARRDTVLAELDRILVAA